MGLDLFRQSGALLEVLGEPVNDVDVFARLVGKLFLAPGDIRVVFAPEVGALHSLYVGVLLASAERCREEGRELEIVCGVELGRLLRVIGGEYLRGNIRVEN